jgi:hypothetical protein
MLLCFSNTPLSNISPRFTSRAHPENKAAQMEKSDNAANASIRNAADKFRARPLDPDFHP